MKHVRKAMAFLNGVREFKLTATTHYDDWDLLEAYDWGRALAHRVTAGRYEPF